MNSILKFNTEPFITALKAFFEELKVPVNYLTDEPTSASEILKFTYKNNENFQLIKDVYFVGIIDDAAFEGNNSIETDKIKSDYDGILIFGITLLDRPNGILPTRSQLAEISRAFNREFYYTPVIVVFQYGEYLAFANTERLKYKQEWREGEKAGKVTLLRDININKTHSGHLRILSDLTIKRSGRDAVNNFADLYKYWQSVLNISILNKKFYQEIFYWYLWAINKVSFPNRVDDDKDDTVCNSESVIRLLTRLIFVWFIKEKKLVPETLFDEVELNKYLSKFNPNDNNSSDYYKAILQNLFFATLNSEMPKDAGERRFINTEKKIYNDDYLLHLVYRYEELFKDSEEALKLFKDIPFLNGGLFECLDFKDEEKGIEYRYDGFSTYPEKQPHIPNILFFGKDDDVDLSKDLDGAASFKHIPVRGLINILKDYKFTIEENTPLEQEIALDPELLGRMFENLLASYNPETKTTARKQTGSFYTPREIVSYMVDESLKVYLLQLFNDKNSGSGYLPMGSKQPPMFDNNERGGQMLLETELENTTNKKSIKEKLETLFNNNSGENPFNESETNIIIEGISNCKILDPACGSGAFPMGILHRMVDLLRKLDKENLKWKEVQRDKTKEKSKKLWDIDDSEDRKAQLEKINKAFDESINHPDYARKLFLIENCIYGVDIQTIAVQISKLRFFISLIVEQIVDDNKKNRNILSMPNLEAKFVAANTLIGLDCAEQLKIESNELISLKAELKEVRHLYFSASSRPEKLKYQKKEKELRKKIGTIIKTDALNEQVALKSQLEKLKYELSLYYKQNRNGLKVEKIKKLDKSIAENIKKIGEIENMLTGENTITNDATKISSFDPYNQICSNSWFDSDWMFDIKDGFDVVIGNPPYIKEYTHRNAFDGVRNSSYYQGKMDLWYLFACKNLDIIKHKTGLLCFIATNNWTTNAGASKMRNKIIQETKIEKLLDFGCYMIFESADIQTMVMLFRNDNTNDNYNFELRRLVGGNIRFNY